MPEPTGPRRVHCRREKHDVYIGRPSKWGNPFSHLFRSTAEVQVNSREEAVECYAEWIKTQAHLMESLHELRGKVLGCWCGPDEACHGDVLLKMANE